MQDKALTVWPMDGLTRVFPRDPAPRGAARLAAAGWQLKAARGEYVSFQLGVRTQQALDSLAVEVIPARKGTPGLPSSAFRARWVGLVPVPPERFDVEAAERPDYVPGWYPDPLQDGPPWQLRAKDGPAPCVLASAVHITLEVSRRTAAGLYRNRVVLKRDGKPIRRIPLSVEVWPFSIPARPTFHVTNWLQLDCITKWHRCPAWSPRHWRLMERYAAEMAAHRQDVIATPTLTGNFHNSDPMTLVATTRRKGGNYTFDFRKLERWVELFTKHRFRFFEMWHLAAQATGKTLPPLRLYDEVKGRDVWYEGMSTDSARYRKLVGSFLDALTVWLARRKLTDRFLVHVFDEPHRAAWPRYAKLEAFFRKHAPGIRHLDAISTSDLITEFGADIDFPVPLTRYLADDVYYQERAKAGRRPVWWYTCCGPAGRFANRFVQSPLLNTRMLHWQSFAYAISGYLHWGYNFWHRTRQNASGWPGINTYADHQLLNPYREHPAHWAVGDTCIVYPPPKWWQDLGPVSSLRYEAMREGLQDYELLRMLQRAVEPTKAQPGSRTARARAAGRRLLKAVRGPIAGSLTEYERNPKRLLRAREQAGDCIAALS